MDHRATHLVGEPEPPGEPPAEVTAELQWRLAVRLRHEHRVREGPPPRGTRPPDNRPRCEACDQPWPCSGRRLAELGLILALA